MTEASTPIEEPAAEETPTAQEGQTGGGPGLLLGLLLGAIAGALAARLLTPKDGAAPAAGSEAEPGERAATILDTVRARLQEASQEAREAAQEAETRLQARYSELTRNDGR